jgi:hypothetical protein
LERLSPARCRRSPTRRIFAEQKPTEYLAKDRLLGANVRDKDGKIIGDIATTPADPPKAN